MSYTLSLAAYPISAWKLCLSDTPIVFDGNDVTGVCDVIMLRNLPLLPRLCTLPILPILSNLGAGAHQFPGPLYRRGMRSWQPGSEQCRHDNWTKSPGEVRRYAIDTHMQVTSREKRKVNKSTYSVAIATKCLGFFDQWLDSLVHNISEMTKNH